MKAERQVLPGRTNRLLIVCLSYGASDVEDTPRGPPLFSTPLHPPIHPSWPLKSVAPCESSDPPRTHTHTPTRPPLRRGQGERERGSEARRRSSGAHPSFFLFLPPFPSFFLLAHSSTHLPHLPARADRPISGANR